MNKVILFDLDGTLIESTEAIVSTFHYSFEELNYDFKGSDEDIKDLIGYPLDIMYEELGVPKQRVWDFVASYKKRYRVISKIKTTLLEDAVEAVKLASTFARLAIVTTKTGLYSQELLEHMDLMQYFELVTGRENVENPKPHKEPIIKTLELMNVELSENIWMIGDTKLDLLSASNAGVKSIAVLCGYGKEEELKQYTSNIKSNSLEAVKYIKNYK